MPGELILAFDDIISGTDAVYSASFLNDVLGELESYAIAVTVDRTTVVSEITVQLETSGDGRLWVEKNPGQPEVHGYTTGLHTFLTGVDIGLRPALAFVRLRVQLVDAGTAHVRIHVREGRDMGFVPARLAGCRVWLRGDLGVTLDGNSAVSRWQDMTGNGFDAVQATTTRRPQVATGATLVGGRPAVTFSAATGGQEKILTLGGSLAGLTAGNAFIVFKRTVHPPVSAARSGFWTLGTSGQASHLPYYSDGKVWDDCGSTVRKDCGVLAPTLLSPSYYEVRCASGAWSNWINGTSQFSTGTNTVGFASAPALGGNSAVGSYFDGAIAEFALYNRILSSNERALLVHYFNARYAL